MRFTDTANRKRPDAKDALVGQLQAGVENMLELIASEWGESEQPNDGLIESVRASLASICQSTSEYGNSIQTPSKRTKLPAVRLTDRPRASAEYNLIAAALQDAVEGSAILTPSGEIQFSNLALVKLSPARLSSFVGCSLVQVLQCEWDDYANILARVTAGIPWSGKLVAGQSRRSYWVSLSCSTALEPSAPIVALVTEIADEDSDTEQRLREQAMHDKLTGLPNRRYFCEHLEKLLEELSTTNGGAEVSFIDLDDFKHVNDYTGHANGDLLLKAMGERIQSVFGPDAFVSRFGGDEFAVVLVDTDAGHSLEPYERLRQALREPFALSEAEAQMSVSIGVTRFPEHGTEIDVLMSGADAAMYAAKSLGKNQVVLFSSQLEEDIAARKQVRSKLRRALDDGEIELWFQPKVDAHSGQHVGCEALARWRTPAGEYIPPSQFVPIAEQTGLISPLGNKVFLLAAEQACKWRSQDIMAHIAVNVSPQQLRHPRFVQQLRQILADTQAQAEWFELEITENAVMEDVSQAVSIMDELCAMGFRIAIDDFGTGYSSLSYLKNFSIHTLKIDLSFVRDLMHDEHSDAIVRSIISLGSGLNLKLVAEGVETTEQANFLRDAGCDILQGYLIGKPVPHHLYEEWLRSH